MDKISLLHIGDIHYADKTIHSYPLESLTVDEYVWPTLSDPKRKSIAPYLIRAVKKQLFRHIEGQTFNSIILTGDLCSYGEINDYEACLNYLEIQFQNFCKKVQREDLEIAVGNHDLDAECPYDQKNIESRFSKFCYLLESKGLRKYPIMSVSEKIIPVSVGKVLLLNVNSCLDFRNLDLHSMEIQGTINRILDDEKDEKQKQRLLNYLLNVPYIRDPLITEICEKIKSNPDCLPIIITHHNFLSNRVFNPRKGYGGILNDGIVMQKLLDLDRSVLVLHGHIHDDPIRVINSNNGKIVYISAPLLFPLINRDEGEKFGYNVIHIIFSNTRDHTPLGCEIEHYQLENFNVVIKSKEQIRFFDFAKAVERLSDLEKVILKKILCSDMDMYLCSLFDFLKEEKFVDDDYTITELTEIVRRLYWLELVEFRERQTNIEYSILRGWF